MPRPRCLTTTLAHNCTTSQRIGPIFATAIGTVPPDASAAMDLSPSPRPKPPQPRTRASYAARCSSVPADDDGDKVYDPEGGSQSSSVGDEPTLDSHTPEKLTGKRGRSRSENFSNDENVGMSQSHAPSRLCTTTRAPQLGLAHGPAQIPATVEVICGTLRGTYDVAKTKILYLYHLGGIREATPTEFERLGGRQATKKWKQSIRVVDSHGQPGKSLGEWLAGTAGTAGEGQRQAFAWLTMGQRTGGGWAEGAGDAGGRGGAAQSSSAQLREQFHSQLLDFLTGRIDNPGTGPGRPLLPDSKFGPVTVGSHSFDLQKMYGKVRELGGYAALASNPNGWNQVAEKIGLDRAVVNTAHACRSVYEHYLLRAERLEKAREAAGIPLPSPPPPAAAPGAVEQPDSPTASEPSGQTGGGGAAGAAPIQTKHEPHTVDRHFAAAAAAAAASAAALERSDRAAAVAASQRALSSAVAQQQHQLDRPPVTEGRGGGGRRGAAAAAAPPPSAAQWAGAATGSRSGGAGSGGQHDRRGGHLADDGGRSGRDAPGGRGPYEASTGRNAGGGGGGGGGGYDSVPSEGRGRHDGLDREEYDVPDNSEYDVPNRGEYDVLPVRSGYGGVSRGGLDGGRGGYDSRGRGGYDGPGGGDGGYDSGGRWSFESGGRAGGYDGGGRGGYESGSRSGYSSGGRGGYDGVGGGRGYAFASRLHDGPATGPGNSARYRQEHPSLDRRLTLEALLQGAHAVQPQLVRSYDNQYEQRSSLLPLDINDDQLLLAAGLGLQGAAGRDGGGGGGHVVNPLLLDSTPTLARQHQGGGGGGASIHITRDGGGGGGTGRLQLQIGGGGRQQQDSREAMLVTLAGGPACSGSLGSRGGLMQAIEQAGLVSLAGGPASTASRLLPVTLGRGGGGGGLGVEALHPGWRARAAAAASGGRGGGGGLQLQGGRAAALLGLQGDLAEGVGVGVVDDPMVSNLLSEYFGGQGGGLPVGLVRTGSGNIGLSGLGLAGAGLGGGGGGGGLGYKRGPPDLGGGGAGGGGGGGEPGVLGGGAGGGPHKRQAL
ncbi:hypothetical protein VOLCADRAFT_88962 [Volvox carteri f. nagariensis]|uniref:ARID domain-containing protein n=1 Tax=Volvox carteri f. nagariensis TaxID=3068 RepID=D8TQF4_VOLCA|nr:uncharacterized protein VOLCADRAFT_88962 [Volvox carteri f. nagariensis]EFJ50395.1 hypothetical protein VOLCADRAFT_88962 [Volvox carteri f. nagariensis]|eukprot:XP_002948520.1 hypothetical protein VOLCADRAFT_88962 [Volvox carteri f. nagariensis]